MQLSNLLDRPGPDADTELLWRSVKDTALREIPYLVSQARRHHGARGDRGRSAHQLAATASSLGQLYARGHADQHAHLAQCKLTSRTAQSVGSVIAPWSISHPHTGNPSYWGPATYSTCSASCGPGIQFIAKTCLGDCSAACPVGMVQNTSVSCTNGRAGIDNAIYWTMCD